METTDVYRPPRKMARFTELAALNTRSAWNPYFYPEDYRQVVVSAASESDDGDTGHINCLHPEILTIIFGMLEVRDRGRAAQVCRSWRDAAYRRSIWTRCEPKLHLRRANPVLFPSLVRRGIKRVQILSLRRSLRDVFNGMPLIESLDLSGCYNVSDIGIAHAFTAEVPTLRRLNLSLCKQISDSSLARLAQHCRGLEELDLGGCCNVTNAGVLLVAWGLRSLRRLNLRSCWHVTDQGIASLAGLSSDAAGNQALEHLGLQDCQKLTDDALKHVSCGLKRLKSINLSFCVSISDAGLKHLASMTSLRELNLRSCDNVTDAGMAYLAHGGSRLSSLDVSFCDKIDDQALVNIARGLDNLEQLSMSACPVSDEGLVQLVSAIVDLRTLNIGQCSQITDRSMQAVADHLRKLRCIDLYGCTKITTSGLQKLAALPQLSILNLRLQHDVTALDCVTSSDSGRWSAAWSTPASTTLGGRSECANDATNNSNKKALVSGPLFSPHLLLFS
uniref:EOG090X05GA n=1 Tax=Moina brachiata TaxID=675436 RepID=A0A4Y7NK71_9CRUS|nr:EOG090X05GA [Moina brachiata]